MNGDDPTFSQNGPCWLGENIDIGARRAWQSPMVICPFPIAIPHKENIHSLKDHSFLMDSQFPMLPHILLCPLYKDFGARPLPKKPKESQIKSQAKSCLGLIIPKRQKARRLERRDRGILHEQISSNNKGDMPQGMTECPVLGLWPSPIW